MFSVLTHPLVSHDEIAQPVWLNRGKSEVGDFVVRKNWLLTQPKEGYCLLTGEGIIRVMYVASTT